MKKILIYLLVLSISTSTVYADWVNEWIDQKSVSSPDYFGTQKKGYGSFGNYSARWYNPAEPIATFTPPRFSPPGCGGIDMFMGGFSFLKADYIVEKLKRMMGPAAAAFAYGIAMSALNAQAKGVLDNLQQASDFLNNLQLNECSVSTRAMEIGKHFGEKGADSVNAASARLQGFMGTQGIGNWYETTKQNINKTLNNAASDVGITPNDSVAGCPNEITDIFFTAGSILKNVGDMLGYSDQQINLIRGLVGDVRITQGVPFSYGTVPKCPENQETGILGIIVDGRYYTRSNVNAACDTAPPLVINGANYNNLNTWVNTTLLGIGLKIINQEELNDPGQNELLARIPTPILSAMSTAIYESDNPGPEVVSVANMYSPYISSMFVYNMVGDLYAGIQVAINKVKSIRTNHEGSTNASACDFATADEAIKLLKNVEENLIRLSGNLYLDFGKQASELNAQLALNDDTYKRAVRLKNTVKVMFGGRVANGLGY